jgi:1-acyl-sn-glycerol-3-phosphate acyltransferase
MSLFFWSCNTAFAASLGIWADYERSGQENVPLDGPLLIVANHQSNMDPPVVARSISRRTIFPAKRELFKYPLVDLLLRLWGAFPLTRGEPDTNAYRKILSTLASQNGCVTLFPEGTRTRGSMRQAQSGPAMIALRTGVTVVPVGITGTSELGGVIRALNPIGTIRVRIGRPFKVVDGGIDRKEAVNGATEEIMGRIAELLPESFRGVYGDAAGADRKFTEDFSDA